MVMTLTNDCECTKSGECICAIHPDGCMCECKCVECEIVYVSEDCPCGGNCGCSSTE